MLFRHISIITFLYLKTVFKLFNSSRCFTDLGHGAMRASTKLKDTSSSAQWSKELVQVIASASTWGSQ